MLTSSHKQIKKKVDEVSKVFVFYSHLKYSYYEQSLAVAISTSAVKTTCRMFASLPPCLRLSSSTVWRHNRKYANWPVRVDNGHKKKFVKQSNVNTAAAAKTEKYSYMGCIIHICKLCWRRKKKNDAMYAYFDKTKEKRPSAISQICGWYKYNTDVKNWNLPLLLVYSYIKTQCCCSSSVKSSIRKSTCAQRKQGHRISPLFESRGRVAESRWKQMSWFECAAPPAI